MINERPDTSNFSPEKNLIDMKGLLQKIEIINFKYSILDDENKFNVFEILRNKYDEVHLHSRFICELLKPNGSHSYGPELTDSFLKIVGIENFGLENYSVHREYREIDIFIKNADQAIIIENKIWAEDQSEQLHRYYNLIKNEGYKEIYIFYLTPYGKEPSKESLGDLKLQKKPSNQIDIDENEKLDGKQDYVEVRLISYRIYISEWLEKCFSITAKHPALRETILQYQRLIQNMTGQSHNNKQRMDIYKLMGESNNIEHAHTIANSWNDIRLRTEYDFWTYFEKIINIESHVLESRKFSRHRIEQVINSKRNSSPWYGLKIELSDFKNEKVYLRVQRGKNWVNYGIETVEENVVELEKLINKQTQFPILQGWVYRKGFDPPINFHSFSEKDTLHLCNEEIRKARIEEYWHQVKELIAYYEKIVASDKLRSNNATSGMSLDTDVTSPKNRTVQN